MRNLSIFIIFSLFAFSCNSEDPASEVQLSENDLLIEGSYAPYSLTVDNQIDTVFDYSSVAPGTVLNAPTFFEGDYKEFDYRLGSWRNLNYEIGSNNELITYGEIFSNWYHYYGLDNNRYIWTVKEKEIEGVRYVEFSSDGILWTAIHIQ